MRIFSVPQNYNKANNVSFGRFADTNARDVVQNTMATDDTVMKPVYDSWAKRIEECDFFEAYTDKESGKVKGRFDKEFVDKFVKSTADNKQIGRQITRNMDSLKRNKILDDLSKFYNAKVTASEIRDFEKMFKGIDVAGEHVKMMMEMAKKNEGHENYAAMRAEEEAYR